jgi:predicted amidohydrolase YtcJ
MVMDDMAKYGIVAVPNPVFIWQLGRSFATNLGMDRVARNMPFRSYVNAGVTMASGSDYGVAHHNPWLGFYALLTRIDQTTGEALGTEETVGIEEALKSYTINGAYLSYDEGIRGSLEVGKLADLVVLDVPSIRALGENPELCLEMEDKILLTLVEGKIGFQKEGFPF